MGVTKMDIYIKPALVF